jgi:hypothetical protein
MRRRKRPADDLAGFEQRARVVGSLLRVAELLDPDKERVLGQAKRLRRCAGRVQILRRNRKGAEYRAEAARRRQARQTAIERSLGAMHDRLAAKDRFAAILAGRRPTP